MAGIDDKREQEHKQRVKKLKAKTSKMRLAVVKDVKVKELYHQKKPGMFDLEPPSAKANEHLSDRLLNHPRYLKEIKKKSKSKSSSGDY
jgi:hypothetical protein